MTALETTPQACEIRLVKRLNKKIFLQLFPGKNECPATQSDPGPQGATVLQGETMPLCWTQQGPIYFAELGYPPPDPDSINLAAAVGDKVGFALTIHLPVQLEI